MANKYYRCSVCGNIITMVHESGVRVHCCDLPMTEMIPNTTDASSEKHVPAVKIEGNIVTVQVGEVLHPKTEEHHIEWIFIRTNKGVQSRSIKPGEDPIAVFSLIEGEKIVEAYDFCNLHGLWKKDLE